MGAKLWLLLAVCLPLRHIRVTSSYGERFHPVLHQLDFHAGVDLAARNDTVFAIADGVATTGYNDRAGLFIRIDHGELQSIYGHLSLIGVNAGDPVSCGQPIGLTGRTGLVTGEHLHFALKLNGHWVDPLRTLLLLDHEPTAFP